MEDFVNNPRAVRLTLGLGPRQRPPFLRFDHHGLDTTTAMVPAKGTLHCGICGDDVPLKMMFALNCTHWYCVDCWGGYIESKVRSREVIEMAMCPHPNCAMLMTHEMPAFFCDPEIAREATSVLVQAFVTERRDAAQHVSYCKNPRGCPGIVIASDVAMPFEAVCRICDSEFCFLCDFPPHAPATCDMVSQWEARGGYLETGKHDEAEVRKLKHLTTKPCPKCGVRIEKNLGCPVK